jgi:hypothetical protein
MAIGFCVVETSVTNAKKKAVSKRSAVTGVIAGQSELTRAAPADQLLTDVRGLIESAREQKARAVNSALAGLYWHIGTRIRRLSCSSCVRSTARRLCRRCLHN